MKYSENLMSDPLKTKAIQNRTFWRSIFKWCLKSNPFQNFWLFEIWTRQISDNYCTYIFMFKNVQNLDGILNKNQFLDAFRLFGNFLAHLKKFICLSIQTPNQSKQIVFLCVSCQTMQSLWQVNTYTKPQKLNEPEEFSLSFFYVYLLILFGV